MWGLGLLECSIEFASRFGKMGHGGYWSTFHLGTASLDVGIRVRVRAVDDEMRRLKFELACRHVGSRPQFSPADR